MFFTDRQKEIYESPAGTKYDPLRVDRVLTIASGSRFGQLIDLRNAPLPGPDGKPVGDISPTGRDSMKVAAAEAELELARVARIAFELPAFPDCTDGCALETLYHFLEWMKGKDYPAGTPPSVPPTGHTS